MGEPFPGRGHDHRACLEDALAAARRRCRARGARLTELRRAVLAVVWSSHRPLGAYAILEALAARGQRVLAPSVYRALEFLAGHGLVHRIESLNAYVGCAAPGHAGSGQFLLCERCGAVAEISDPAIARAIERGARATGFRAAGHTVEVRGVCPNCR